MYMPKIESVSELAMPSYEVYEDIHVTRLQYVQDKISLEKSFEIVYNALRQEILKQFDLQQQTITLTWTIAAALFSTALIHPTSPSEALLYPPIAAFLGLMWIQRVYSVRDVANYMSEYLECSLSLRGWETYLKEKGGILRLRYVFISHAGLIIFTQIMAIIIGLFDFDSDSFRKISLGALTGLEICFVALDILSAVFVLYLMLKLYSHESKQRNERKMKC